MPGGASSDCTGAHLLLTESISSWTRTPALNTDNDVIHAIWGGGDAIKQERRTKSHFRYLKLDHARIYKPS